MNITAIASHLLSFFAPEERSIPDSATYPGRNAWVLQTINGALQELFGRGGKWVRQDSRGAILYAPATVSIAVVAGSTSATITAETWLDWMAGCTIEIDGIRNQIRNDARAVTLKFPHSGTTGTVTATVYCDCLTMATDVFEVIEPLDVDGVPLYPLGNKKERNHHHGQDFGWDDGVDATTPTEGYKVETWSPSAELPTVIRLRFVPVPEVQAVVDYSVQLCPPRIDSLEGETLDSYASVTLGTGAENTQVTLTAKTAGPTGNQYSGKILSESPEYKTSASVTIGAGASAVTYTALPGAGGNSITVGHAASSALDTTSVTAVGTDITITKGSRARLTVSGSLTDGTDPVVFPVMQYAGYMLYYSATNYRKIWSSNGEILPPETGTWYRVSSFTDNGTHWDVSLVKYIDGVTVASWVKTGSHFTWPDQVTDLAPVGPATGIPTVSPLGSSSAQTVAALQSSGVVMIEATAGGDGTGEIATQSATPLEGGSDNIITVIMDDGLLTAFVTGTATSGEVVSAINAESSVNTLIEAEHGGDGLGAVSTTIAIHFTGGLYEGESTATLPIPHDAIESIFLPLAEKRLQKSPHWRGTTVETAVNDSYTAAAQLLQTGAPKKNASVRFVTKG